MPKGFFIVLWYAQWNRISIICGSVCWTVSVWCECACCNMANFSDDEDISWLTQSDSGRPNFDLGNSCWNSDVDLVSLEDNSSERVELYDGVFGENISDDEAIDSL